MAKKKSAGAVGARSGKTRVELRLDDHAYVDLKRLADGSGVTVNQLINSLVHWAGKNGTVGEASRDFNGVLQTKKMSGVVWFGKSGYYLTDADKEHYYRDAETPPEFIKGDHFFTLDFTERRVIREDL